MKSLFITNPDDLSSKILGGVQLCSQEFLETISVIDPNVIVFEVNVSKNLGKRIKRKLKIDSYDLYSFKKYESLLKTVIKNNRIDTVFVNKAELIKVSKTLKKFNAQIKVVLMSHGNETGDYLHELAHPDKENNSFKLIYKKIRLGLNLYTESYYRHRYIDLVCAMSQEEESIEKWLGAKETFFFPRIIKSKPVKWNPKSKKIGFVGTLNHTPNYIALQEICKQLSTSKDVTLIIVGSGEQEGRNLSDRYPFVEYLGALDDFKLLEEVSTWMYFINPIFWYSRGASMKLAQALSWNIPVISTIAGARGYTFKKDFLKLTPNNPKAFVDEILARLDSSSESNLTNISENVIFSKEEIGCMLSKRIKNL